MMTHSDWKRFGDYFLLRWRLHVERMLMWHHVDVDSVHVERIAPSGDQLLKNVRYIRI